jgi:hypothetical protein
LPSVALQHAEESRAHQRYYPQRHLVVRVVRQQSDASFAFFGNKKNDLTLLFEFLDFFTAAMAPIVTFCVEYAATAQSKVRLKIPKT